MDIILEAFFDQQIRADQCIIIPMALVHWDGALPDSFTEFFEDVIAGASIDDAGLAELFQTLPALKEFIGRDDFDELDPEHLAEWFITKRHLGMLIQLATPVAQDVSEDGSCWCSSWGCVYTTWIYAQDNTAALDAALSWKADMFTADKKEG